MCMIAFVCMYVCTVCVPDSCEGKKKKVLDPLGLVIDSCEPPFGHQELISPLGLESGRL